ncbi:MAG TPA: hypothetical protein VN709_04040 [Terriglobales bacterium]|nr:hypothetical protein [Terriglobales bacterium]
MSEHIQLMRRVGACENKQAQPDWKGPEIPACTEPASFLCETCGRLLCGGHAGGHWHGVNDSAAVASHFQDEAAQAQARAAAAATNAQVMQQQLAAAQQAAQTITKIRALIDEVETAGAAA